MLYNHLLTLVISISSCFCLVKGDVDHCCANTTTIEKHPWQVSVQRRDNTTQSNDSSWTHVCGGSIVSHHYVITAAHCVHWPNTNNVIPRIHIRIVAGESDMHDPSANHIFSVDSIYTHDNFRPCDVYNFDISIIKIEGAFYFNDTGIKNITLYKDDIDIGIDRVSDCSITGWCTDNMTSLEEMPASFLPKFNCIPNMAADKYNEIPPITYPHVITIPSYVSDNLCVRSNLPEHCAGYQGGPIVCISNNVPILVGIASFFGNKYEIHTQKNNHTARSESAYIFTDMSSYFAWECEHIDELNCVPPETRYLVILFGIIPICVCFIILAICVGFDMDDRTPPQEIKNSSESFKGNVIKRSDRKKKKKKKIKEITFEQIPNVNIDLKEEQTEFSKNEVVTKLDKEQTDKVSSWKQKLTQRMAIQTTQSLQLETDHTDTTDLNHTEMLPQNLETSEV